MQRSIQKEREREREKERERERERERGGGKRGRRNERQKLERYVVIFIIEKLRGEMLRIYRDVFIRKTLLHS